MIYAPSVASYIFFSDYHAKVFSYSFFFSLLLFKILTMGPFCAVIWQRCFLSRRFGLVFRITGVFFFFAFVKFWYFANLFDENIGTCKNNFSWKWKNFYSLPYLGVGRGENYSL